MFCSSVLKYTGFYPLSSQCTSFFSLWQFAEIIHRVRVRCDSSREIARNSIESESEYSGQIVLSLYFPAGFLGLFVSICCFAKIEMYTRKEGDVDACKGYWRSRVSLQVLF